MSPVCTHLNRANRYCRVALSVAACLSGVSALASPVVYSGAGIGTGGAAISASVAFDVVQHDFNGSSSTAIEVTLSNTAASTRVRGNALTGVFFGVTDSARAPFLTTSSGFDGLAAKVRTGNSSGNDTVALDVDIAPAINNTPTKGTFTLINLYQQNDTKDNNGYDWRNYDYAITTIGGGLGGVSGNNVGNDDFGIVAAGTSLAPSSVRGIRLIDGFAKFWIKAPDSIDLSYIDSVQFGYGSLPDNRLMAQRESTSTLLDVTSPVPEPTPLAMCLAAAAGIGWRQRRKSTRS